MAKDAIAASLSAFNGKEKSCPGAMRDLPLPNVGEGRGEGVSASQRPSKFHPHPSPPPSEGEGEVTQGSAAENPRFSGSPNVQDDKEVP